MRNKNGPHWGPNIRQLFSLTDNNEINYYAEQIEKRNLSKRQLEEIIKNREYERLPIETKNKLMNSEKINVKDLVPNFKVKKIILNNGEINTYEKKVARI